MSKRPNNVAGRRARYLQALEVFGQHHPTDPYFQLMVAICLTQLGDYPNAQSFYRLSLASAYNDRQWQFTGIMHGLVDTYVLATSRSLCRDSWRKSKPTSKIERATRSRRCMPTRWRASYRGEMRRQTRTYMDYSRSPSIGGPTQPEGPSNALSSGISQGSIKLSMVAEGPSRNGYRRRDTGIA